MIKHEYTKYQFFSTFFCKKNKTKKCFFIGRSLTLLSCKWGVKYKLILSEVYLCTKMGGSKILKKAGPTISKIEIKKANF